MTQRGWIMWNACLPIIVTLLTGMREFGAYGTRVQILALAAFAAWEMS